MAADCVYQFETVRFTSVIVIVARGIRQTGGDDVWRRHMALTVRMAELHSILAQATTIVTSGHVYVHVILLENIVKHLSVIARMEASVTEDIMDKHTARVGTGSQARTVLKKCAHLTVNMAAHAWLMGTWRCAFARTDTKANCARTFR